jgi:hypothetical protein
MDGSILRNSLGSRLIDHGTHTYILSARC